ncbi:MAG: hypothetical protein [Podoviridae sp. ctpVR23]|nr:MAG: hypothetical protein [Podoviridae sp. ctpVR23]
MSNAKKPWDNVSVTLPIGVWQTLLDAIGNEIRAIEEEVDDLGDDAPDHSDYLDDLGKCVEAIEAATALECHAK